VEADTTDTDLDAILSRAFLTEHPKESARVLEGLDPSGAASVLSESAPEIAAAVLRQMVPASAAACYAQLSEPLAATLLQLISPDSAAGLLRMLSSPAKRAVLDTLPRASADPIRRLLAYPEASTGAVMDPNVFAVSNDVTVRAATESLSRNVNAAIYYVYVVDREQKLVGVLTLRELMRAEKARSIASVMKRNPVFVRARASHLELVRHAGWRRFHAIPVVDDGGLLLGVVRYETLRALEGEFSDEGMQKQGGLNLAASLSEFYVKGLTGLVLGFAPRSSISSTSTASSGSDDEEEKS
jgi:magnesium transporter